ncbi:hypothetical protein [Photobacterium leiognathi]|uniref:hypothetical protein n=1 Tax=Photobacterium leiognathi TaxID=553611 RepID=UPI0029811856|nr:hypothetical protein [Photobacterium leiognathi]
MRNPERITELLDLVKEIWLKQPDLRFNQLLYTLHRQYSELHGDSMQVKELDSDGYTRIGYDLFNVEDDRFIDFLRSVSTSQN